MDGKKYFPTNIQCINIEEKNVEIAWKKLLSSWIEINNRYVVSKEFRDAMFWYNERATISSLAGAVWNCGGFAIEEYCTTKGSGDNRRSGRVDLYFDIDGLPQIVEAKQHWLYYHQNSDFDFVDTVMPTLNEALKDTEDSLANSSARLGFGIVFVVPFWKTESLKAVANEHVLDGINRMEKNLVCLFKVPDGRELKSSRGNYFDSVYLLGKYQKKDNHKK